jgi:signal transduction histidine kinase
MGNHQAREVGSRQPGGEPRTLSSRSLKLLLVEDSEDDAELLLRELRRAKYGVEWERVDTASAMRAALDRQAWDAILSDHHLAHFNALDALAVVKERRLDVPFIMIVSGKVGEAAAVKAMRAGVHDYLLRGALTRLPAALERELRDAADRAERRHIHEQLIISDRMASVGTLAAGVAHEINNPLAAVLANLDFSIEILGELASDLRGRLGSRVAAGDPSGGRYSDSADVSSPDAGGPTAADCVGPRLIEVEPSLKDAREAADRVRVIVRDLKIFSRSGDDERSGAVDLTGVLESSLRMAWNEIHHRARLVKDYGDIPAAQGNEARLGQVFLNLIVNAARAIPEGNTEENEIRISTAHRGDQIVVEVRDTGGGIAPEVLPRIFEPFFTPRSVGAGAGLGLGICHRILTDLGGSIEVESDEGRSTVFRVTLPVAQPRVDQGPGATLRRAAGTAVRRGTIMVIDDEPMIGTVVSRMLSPDHDVVPFTSVREGLEAMQAGRSFDIILCDLMMPEMTGMDLHTELERTAPGMAGRIVFMTGGAFAPRSRAYLAGVSNALIEKPFDATELRTTIENLLVEPSTNGVSRPH